MTIHPECPTRPECPNCGSSGLSGLIVHNPDCSSCHGETGRACLACYGGFCSECGVSVLPRSPYSDDCPRS